MILYNLQNVCSVDMSSLKSVRDVRVLEVEFMDISVKCPIISFSDTNVVWYWLDLRINEYYFCINEIGHFSMMQSIGTFIEVWYQ